MTPENFCFWLNGHFELQERDIPITPRQTKIIQEHLALVFDKVTPDHEKEDMGTTAKPTEFDIDDLEEVSKILDNTLKDWQKENNELNPWKWPVVDPAFPISPPTIPTYPSYDYPNIICSDKACSEVPDFNAVKNIFIERIDKPNPIDWKVDPSKSELIC